MVIVLVNVMKAIVLKIDNTIEKKVDKNENIALESDDDNDFYPISNVPSNSSSNDDIEDLTSSLNDLSIQSCNNENATVSASNTKGVDNQLPNITFYLKLKAKLFISIQIQNHGMKLLF